MFLISPFVKAIKIEKKRQIKKINFKLSEKCSLVTKSISKSFLFLCLTKKLFKVARFITLIVVVKRKMKEFSSDIERPIKLETKIVNTTISRVEIEDIIARKRDLLSLIKYHTDVIPPTVSNKIEPMSIINS